LIYLDKGCYETFKNNTGYLEHFNVVFSEFQKNKSKICTQHRSQVRKYCDGFQEDMRKITESGTYKDKKALQSMLYPLFVKKLCKKSESYTCLEGTEFFLALLPDWREKLKTPRRVCYDSDEHTHRYNALEIYLNKKNPCKKI